MKLTKLILLLLFPLIESALRKGVIRKLQATNTCSISGNITQIGKELDKHQNTDAEVRKTKNIIKFNNLQI